jgi:anaerobic selenocysteine-containing dehydrogenase
MSGHLYDLFSRFATAIGAPPPLLFDLYTAFHGHRVLRDTSRDLFGIDALPSYDVGNADVVFSFGADLAGTWLSPTRYGIEYGRLRSQPLGKRGYLVQFEPGMSPTGAKADRWLPIRPGSEPLVAQAIVRLIADQKLGAPERVERAATVAGPVDVGAVAEASDISAEELTRLARLFATTERSMAIPGSALTGRADAASAVTAVQVLNWVVGRIGSPGALSLLTPAADTFVSPTPSPLADARRLIQQMRAGDIQVLLVYGANPAYELPPAFDFDKAIANVPFVVSFAPIPDETAAWADLLLPDHTYLETWGYEVVDPSFDVPVIGSQQPVVTPYFDTRSTGDVLLAVAQQIPSAAQALPWADEVAFIKQTVAQLPAGTYSEDPDERWARFLQHGGWWPAAKPAAPANVATVQAPSVQPAQFDGDVQQYPFFLHLFMSPLLGDGSSANLPWLQGSPDPMTTISWQTWVELNPATAEKLGVGNGDVVKVTSSHGEIEAPVYVYPAVRPDTVAVPLGQGHTAYGRYASGRGANPLRLVGASAGQAAALPWALLRVSVRPTGRHVALATFEYTTGVTREFIAPTTPGQ